MNAIPAPLPEDRAARRARLLRQCEHLAAMAIDLAEDARREAKRDLLPPRQARAPIPGMHPNADLPETPERRDDTFGHLFAVLSRAARQAIMLEARLDAGAFDHLPPDTTPTPHPSTARAAAEPLSSPPPHGSEAEPRLHHERLEDDLAADTNRSPESVLSGIRAELERAADHLPRPLCPDRQAAAPSRLAVDLSLRPPRPPTQAERAALRYAETHPDDPVPPPRKPPR